MKRSILYNLCIFIYYSILFSFFQLRTINYWSFSDDIGSIIGQVTKTNANWVGKVQVDRNIPILIMAGHADSQGLSGAGTAGEAVDIFNAKPMDSSISDELFWNIKIRDSVVINGQKRGLNIIAYDPGVRNIDNENDPRTNWSVGEKFAKGGGYPIEIHFDSYGEYGLGSGLIPPLDIALNSIDESLAQSFGRYPIFFRGGLGAPKRKIRILEIGKLEGKLERNLRDSRKRDQTINIISNQVISSILSGLKKKIFNPTLDEDDIFLPAIYL